jgi:putative FmdB family regulatory protein
MPIYEYVCNDCNEKFEIFQRISEPPLDKCSRCGGKMTKLISNTSFILKGSGWYVTDYGSKKGKEGKDFKEKGDSDSKGDEKGKKEPSDKES